MCWRGLRANPSQTSSIKADYLCAIPVFSPCPSSAARERIRPASLATARKGRERQRHRGGEREWEFKFVTNKQRSWQNDTKEYVVNLFCRIEKRLQNRRAPNCTDQRGKKTQIWELYSLHSQLCLLNRNPKYKLSIILCLYRREGRLMSASRQRHSFRKSSDSACRGDLITAQHHVTWIYFTMSLQSVGFISVGFNNRALFWIKTLLPTPGMTLLLFLQMCEDSFLSFRFFPLPHELELTLCGPVWMFYHTCDFHLSRSTVVIFLITLESHHM